MDCVLGAESDIKLKIFTENYARLTRVLPIKNLTSYLVKENIINFEEEKIIHRTVGQSRAASFVLRKISHSLKAHMTEEFDTLLSIMEQHGGISCVELVNEMRQHLPQETTGNVVNY